MLKDNNLAFSTKMKPILVVDENYPFSKEFSLLFVSKSTPREHPYMMSDFMLARMVGK